jgi:hypothetical protein
MKKIVTTLLFLESCLVAQVVPNYLDLSLGYRNDQITNNRISAFDSTGALVLDENIDITQLNVYQIGAKVRYEPFCNLFGRGSCWIGTVNGGDYKERDYITTTLSNIHAKINHGQTIDWDLEGGYQLDFFGVGLAPIFGWSYNKQDIRFRNVTNNGPIDPYLNGLRYVTYWNGPFVAVDLFYEFCNILINGGYEYHWAHWKGRYMLPVPSDKGVVFSNTRRSHHAIGNVVYIDVLWNYFCDWAVGVSYKYQDYQTCRGDFSPDWGTFTSQGFPQIVKTDVPKAEWQSHQVTLDLRYLF